MASVTAGVIAGLGSAAGSLISAGTQAAGAASAQHALEPFVQSDAPQTLGNALGANGPALAAKALGQFQTGPGYQWQQQQGIDAIQNSASAQGGVVSGNTLKALDTYGQGLANQSWQQWLTNLLNLSSLGENAAAGVGNAGMQGANAQAAGTVGATNSLTSLLPFLFGNNSGGSPVLSNGTLLASNTAGNPLYDPGTGLAFNPGIGN